MNKIMELAEAMAAAMAGKHDAMALIEARAALKAEVERVQVVADRYRWLSSRATQEIDYYRLGKGGLWSIGIHSCDSRYSFCEAIDAARSKT